MIVNKSVIRKEVKSTNEQETRKKQIMIFNLKNKTGKADVDCVKDMFGQMGAGQGRERERGKEDKNNEAERRENTEI